MAEKKISAWMTKIRDRETANNMVRECGIAMLFWAVVQAGFSFKYGNTLLIHAAILALGGFALWRWQSRIAAVVLLVYAVAAASITMAIHNGVAIEGNHNNMLALLVVWTAYKGLEASFRLRGRFAITATPDNPLASATQAE